MSKSVLIIILAGAVLGGVYYYQKDAFRFETGPILGSSVHKESGMRYLVDPEGRTLYVFADDQDGKSFCFDLCINNWPIYVATQDPSNLNDALSKRINVLRRQDGQNQYVYGNKPLYYYNGDLAPGDTKGNGLNDGKWAIVPLTE